MHARINLRTQLSPQVRRPDLAHIERISKTMQGNFSSLILSFRMNPTSSGSHSKPLFSHYKQPYMVYFQNTQISHGKTLRFTRNSESKREFFTKHPQVNFLLIRAFSSRSSSLRLLITIFFFNCEQIQLKGTVKIKPRSFCFEVFSSKLFSLFSILILLFILFLGLFYVFIYLCSLGLCSFYVLKHVRILDLLS